MVLDGHDEGAKMHLYIYDNGITRHVQNKEHMMVGLLFKYHSGVPAKITTK